MKKIVTLILTMVFAVASCGVPVMAVSSVLCDQLTSEEDKAAAGCGSQKGAGEVAQAVINVVLGIVGVVAVVMMIYGGYVFLTSTGDASRVKKGQDAIKYGLIGLIVAILAYAIVAFVSAASVAVP